MNIPSAEILEPRATDLVPERCPFLVAEQLGFTEGPVWRPAQSDLIFSDIPGNAAWRWSPADGLSVVRRPSNKANGNALDQQGNLVTCEHVTSRVVRERGGTFEVVAQSYQGRRLNSPNDVIVAGDGAILFSDPTYGLTPDIGLEREQELDWQGVYLAESDALRLLADDFDQPNGLCLSPDETLLYVNDSERQHIRKFSVGDGWKVRDEGLFAELRADAPGVPDGMKCDEQGNVWCTGPGGIWVFNPGGDVLLKIRTPEECANFAFGGQSKKSLFLTTSTSVWAWPSVLDQHQLAAEQRDEVHA